MRASRQNVYAAAFLGVLFAFVFFTVGFFFVVAVVFCLLTRPDLVFLRTVGTSWTAGAGAAAALAAFGFDARLVAVLAFGLAAVFAFVVVLALVVLVAAFFGAAFLATLGLVSAFSFYTKVSAGGQGWSGGNEPWAERPSSRPV
jgi:hypothetical protein